MEGTVCAAIFLERFTSAVEQAVKEAAEMILEQFVEAAESEAPVMPEKPRDGESRKRRFREHFCGSVEEVIRAALETVIGEFTGFVDSRFADFQLKMSVKDKEIDSLRLQLQVCESELRAAKGHPNSADSVRPTSVGSGKRKMSPSMTSSTAASELSAGESHPEKVTDNQRSSPVKSGDETRGDSNQGPVIRGEAEEEPKENQTLSVVVLDWEQIESISRGSEQDSLPKAVKVSYNDVARMQQISSLEDNRINDESPAWSSPDNEAELPKESCKESEVENLNVELLGSTQAAPIEPVVHISEEVCSEGPAHHDQGVFAQVCEQEFILVKQEASQQEFILLKRENCGQEFLQVKREMNEPAEPTLVPEKAFHRLNFHSEDAYQDARETDAMGLYQRRLYSPRLCVSAGQQGEAEMVYWESSGRLGEDSGFSERDTAATYLTDSSHADSSLSSFSETPSLQRLPQSEGRWLGDAETPQPTQDVLIQYHCPECTETFFDLECLVQHRQVHSLETDHPDDPSGPLSGQEIVLNPQTPKKWYECDECGKKVLSKRSLLQHQAIHTGEKPYCCDECGMRFALKTYFQYHQMVHSGERPYPCSLCEKTFRGIAALREHYKIHSGEKRFMCTECGKRFRTKSNLTTHKSVHTDERPHACSECGKSFKLKGDLVKHKKLHLADKPYPCAECGKRFRTKSNLKSHYSVHSEERPYSCAECGKSFKQRGDLLKHMKIHFIERIWCPTEGRVLIH
ncbi:zinc finger and SCAN domain-containing protein 2-like [Erpetoichthys calabaricus]|uniref:zinc finger and SCAN domain-containing protein 2-like n=1 Tax=Erpetoichthys calabaricus TaxID=27687 RepID=UPI0022342A5E|nr:zinc finger and SCAN domain-containing protein 2-like [Erpetoichthys calabaricus]